MEQWIGRVLWVNGERADGALQPDLLLQGAGSTFQLERVRGIDGYAHSANAHDALVFSLGDDAGRALLAWPALASACVNAAVVVLAPEVDTDTAVRLLQGGVQDVVLHCDAGSFAMRLRLAVARKQAEQETRKSYASDLGTGLPNRHQLIEHMSQILALREREPRPVSVLVFRMDGLHGVESAHGLESANVVRRKIAVRLRVGVRASDVVASLGADVYAVLLPSTESPADAQRVVDKLVRSLREPFNVAGSSVGVSAHVGVAQFPQDGRQPDALLRHASAEALLGAYGMQSAAND